MKLAWIYLHNTVTDKYNTPFTECMRTGVMQLRYRLALRQTPPPYTDWTRARTKPKSEQMNRQSMSNRLGAVHSWNTVMTTELSALRGWDEQFRTKNRLLSKVIIKCSSSVVIMWSCTYCSFAATCEPVVAYLGGLNVGYWVATAYVVVGKIVRSCSSFGCCPYKITH